MLNTTWTDDMVVKFGSKYAQDAVIGQAIGTGFVWLVAQAYDQGITVCGILIIITGIHHCFISGNWYVYLVTA